MIKDIKPTCPQVTCNSKEFSAEIIKATNGPYYYSVLYCLQCGKILYTQGEPSPKN